MSIVLFLIETKIGRAILITIGAIIIVTTSWLTFKIHYENIGYAKAMHLIAINDAKAKKDGENAYSETKACYDSGGTWDVSGGGIFNAGGVCIK